MVVVYNEHVDLARITYYIVDSGTIIVTKNNANFLGYTRVCVCERRAIELEQQHRDALSPQLPFPPFTWEMNINLHPRCIMGEALAGDLGARAQDATARMFITRRRESLSFVATNCRELPRRRTKWIFRPGNRKR